MAVAEFISALPADEMSASATPQLARFKKVNVLSG